MVGRKNNMLIKWSCDSSKMLLNTGKLDLTENERERVLRFHQQQILENQCGNMIFKEIEAPIDAAWQVLRRFDNPQSYKKFLHSSVLIHGNGEPGSIRRVKLISGLPGIDSIERLEILDEVNHVSSFRILGGAHRLENYCSITSLTQRIINGKPVTLVTESYVVDIPEGNTADETVVFVDTIAKCNLDSLGKVSQTQYRESLEMRNNDTEMYM